ncbi:MAG: hypothetical protein GY856_14050 [bacterium]|nr:hypothetical protein [bacterium]
MIGILALIMPDPERTELARRSRLDVPFWSFCIGVVEFLGFVLFLFHDGQQYIESAVVESTRMFVEEKGLGTSFAETLALFWSGAFAWLMWMTRPYTWFLGSFVVAGIGRMVAFGLSREAMGEPVVWASLRIFQVAGRLLRGSSRKLQFGPPRPDRWLREPGSDLVLLTCRELPDWNEYVTIEVKEQFYRLNRVEERLDGAWKAYAYLLREEDPNEIIRALVRYEPIETG